VNTDQYPGSGRQLREPVAILLVEDDTAFAELVRAQLRRMPWVQSRLEVAGTLRDALTKLAGESFGLVVTDLNLPDSRGLDTLGALSQAGEQPIIVLSGDPNPALRAGAMDAGVFDYLSKDSLSAAVLERLVRLASIQANTFRLVRDSEARFRSLIRLSTESYWETDAEHRVVKLDLGTARGTARNPDQMGKTRWDLPSTWPDAEGWAAHRAALDAHRPFRDFEFARREADGVERWRSISGEPVFDAGGAFVGYRGVGRDITERRRAADELQRFRAAMDESADMIVLVDRETMRFVDVNRTICRLTGYSREELLAMGPQDVLPLSREQIAQAYDDLIADPSQSRELKSYYRCKDGSQLPFESTRRVLPSGSGWIIAAISRDIRNRLAAEKALHESEGRFRSLNALSSDWYWEQDSEFRLTFMSSIEKLGLDATKYLGARRWDRPALNLDEADWSRHREQLERHEPFHDFEMERPGPDGASVWLSLSGEPVFDADGQFAGYRGVGRDITARKREERLKSLEHAVTLCLAESESEAEALRGVLRAVCQTEKWDCGRYYNVDGNAGVLRLLEAWAAPGSALDEAIDASRGVTFERGAGISGRVWQSGEPLWVADIQTDPRAAKRVLLKDSGMRGGFCFPVTAGGAPLGVLIFNARDVRPPDERLQQAASVIGSQVGQFLQRKRAEQQAARLVRINVALAAANEAVLRAKTQQEVFERACQIAVDAGDFLIGTVFVIDPKTRALTRAAVSGRAASKVDPVQPTFDPKKAEGKGLIGEACRTGKPAISNDYDADPRTSRRRGSYEVGSAAVFPLHVEGELLGVFGLQHAQRDAFGDELTGLLQRLADNIAFALETFRANRRRRAAKRKLAESEERFRSLTGLSSDMYWEQDEDYRFTVLSDSGPKWLNAGRRQSMLGKRRWDQRYFNMREQDWAVHRATLAARQPFHDLELGRISESGEQVWVTVSGEPFFDETGKFRGYRGIGKEITERKRGAQLRELEHSVTRSLAEADSVEEAFDRVIRSICATESWDCGRYFSPDEQDRELRFREGWGVDDPAVQRFVATSGEQRFARGVGLAGRVWESGEPIWVPDVRDDARVSTASHSRENGMHGAFVFPVLADGRAIGVLAFNSRAVRKPEHRMLQAIRVIGSQIGQFVQRKQAEATRRSDEDALRRFRAAMDTSADMILLVDRETMRYIDANATACEKQGYTREELLCLGPADVAPVPREELERSYDAMIASGETMRQLSLQRRKDGSKIPVEVVRRAVRVGQRWIIVAIVRDISERVAAELALRESEARFRSLTKLSSDWFWQTDAEHRFVDTPDRVTELTGLGAATYVGKRRWEIPGLMPVSGDWKAHHETLGRRDSYRDLELLQTRADGSRVYLQVSGEPVFDADGRFAGYRGTARDITVRKQEEEELRRFRAAMDMSLDAIYLTDRATMRFIDVNKVGCKWLGYTREELLGLGPESVLPATREQLEREYDQVIAAGSKAVRIENSYITKDGRRGWSELHRRALREGERWIIVTISRDISERKLAEERQAQHLRHQERIARFGQAALAKRQPAELVREGVQNVLEGLAADAVAYFEPGKAPGEAILHALAGSDEGRDGAALACGEANPLQRALRSGEPLVVDGAELQIDWAAGLRSTALVPVRGERGTRGALCVGFRAANAFAPDALNFVEAAASVLSTGLQRIDSEGRLAFLAQFDSLTGLPNRALLADRFAQMIVLARRRAAGLSVLFVDLDEFKVVNDTLGHAGGDELLKEVAVRLQACVRSGDTVARISGDEFAVVLADLARAEDAAMVAQKILERLGAAFEVCGQEAFVSASIGIAAYPGDGQEAEALIGAADAAMYRAKQAGRNTYQFFTAEINQRSRSRAQLGVELRRALEREEFTVYYQPKVELNGRRLHGAEALLRWKHPERGLVSPAEFIPVLEESGLIVPVGEWVLRRACADLKTWQAAGLAVGPVAVNLSARQFRMQDLDARIKTLVGEAGVAPSLVELEITESQLMHDPDHAIRVMRSLDAAGMRIAIDDFGTGYSSLAYLTRFPVGALKIDRSFVAAANQEPSAATIVRTIIEMAHSLGFTVVAEGVETEEQATFLRLLRCERAQGYLFARPMPAEALEALLRESQGKKAN
jgi:diguanylate cyclase (GGDEF)-like protein/PAS domain S-box-containing protein